MAAKKMSGRELVRQYENLVGDLEQEKHVIVEKDIFDVSVEYNDNTNRISSGDGRYEAQPEHVRLNNHFEWVARRIKIAKALRDRLHARRFDRLRWPGEQQALDNVEEIYNGLKRAAVSHAREALRAGRMGQGIAESGEAGVRESHVRFKPQGAEVKNWPELVKVAEKHYHALAKL